MAEKNFENTEFAQHVNKQFEDVGTLYCVVKAGTTVWVMPPKTNWMDANKIALALGGSVGQVKCKVTYEPQGQVRVYKDIEELRRSNLGG